MHYSAASLLFNAYFCWRLLQTPTLDNHANPLHDLISLTQILDFPDVRYAGRGFVRSSDFDVQGVSVFWLADTHTTPVPRELLERACHGSGVGRAQAIG